MIKCYNMNMKTFVTRNSIMEMLNIIVIIISPILAVVIGRYLQDKSEKRKDKMQIFKILMATRIYGWTLDKVYALNILDVVFVDDKEVRQAWQNLYEKYCIKEPNNHQLEEIKLQEQILLERMALSLGFKNKITWETIQKPYMPQGMLDQITTQNMAQQRYNNILDSMSEFVQSKQGLPGLITGMKNK